MSINKIILIGNVGKEPEVRQVGEQKVAQFSLATSEKVKDTEVTQWHNLVVWGKLAEVCDKYVHKGTKIYVEGSIRYRQYDANGTTKYITEVMVRSLEMLGGKESTAPATTARPSKEENDLPF